MEQSSGTKVGNKGSQQSQPAQKAPTGWPHWERKKICAVGVPCPLLWACTGGQWGRYCWGPVEHSHRLSGCCRQPSGRRHSPGRKEQNITEIVTYTKNSWCACVSSCIQHVVWSVCTHPINVINPQSLTQNAHCIVSWLCRRGARVIQ